MKHTENKSRKLKRSIVLFSFIVAGSILFLVKCSSFGRDASGERLKRIQASPHYKDGVFVNTVPVAPTYRNDIHMGVEDAIQAHLDVLGRRLLPVHWATFNMANHDWDEPIKQAVKAAHEKDVDLVTPRVGEVVTVGRPFLSQRWWEKVK